MDFSTLHIDEYNFDVVIMYELYLQMVFIIFSEKFPEPLHRGLWVSSKIFVVHIEEPKPLAQAIQPFKIIQERPYKVPANIWSISATNTVLSKSSSEGVWSVMVVVHYGIKQGWLYKSTLNSPISVGYYLELHLAITFYWD